MSKKRCTVECSSYYYCCDSYEIVPPFLKMIGPGKEETMVKLDSVTRITKEVKP